MPFGKTPLPPVQKLRDDVKAKFGIHPCLYQTRDALAQLKGEDCITIAATGSGKTLTFWIPLLYIDNGYILIITALNILGDQNVKELEALGIKAVNLTSENASNNIFKDIENGIYRVIVVSPEKVLSDKRFDSLWASKKFTSKLFNVSIDEGHCVSQWGAEFRPEYAELGRLRWLLPDHVRFHVVSATMPKLILADVKNKLRISGNAYTLIRRSNDRENIHLVVEEFKYPVASFLDLRRILQLNRGEKPPKFMVFTNKRHEAERAVHELWKDLPLESHNKIVWFHSGMSAAFREEYIEKLKRGVLWGMVCTDAAGMGLDISDIELVVQWHYIASLCTLMQRLGRGARKKGKKAVGVYLVEPTYFDDSKCKRKRSGKKNTTHNLANDDNDDESTSEMEDEVLHKRRWMSVTIMRPSEGQTTTDAQSHLTPIQNDPSSIPFPKSRAKSEAEYEADVMDLYINAKSRRVCRRAVSNWYFGNHLADVYEEECGCEKCVRASGVSESHTCCDACHPTAFVSPQLVQEPAKPIRKRKINTKPLALEDMEDRDIELNRALREWRRKELQKRRFEGEDYFGPQMIMAERVLKRIVDLAREAKLTSDAVFIEQVQWHDASKYAEDIMSIIRSIHTPPPDDNVPFMTLSENTSLSQVPPPTSRYSTADKPSVSQGSRGAGKENKAPRTTSRPRQCKKCKSFGHIASNSMCPLKTSRNTAVAPAIASTSTPTPLNLLQVPVSNMPNLVSPALNTAWVAPYPPITSVTPYPPAALIVDPSWPSWPPLHTPWSSIPAPPFMPHFSNPPRPNPLPRYHDPTPRPPSQ